MTVIGIPPPGLQELGEKLLIVRGILNGLVADISAIPSYLIITIGFPDPAGSFEVPSSF